VIRVGAGMSTTRFCHLFDMPERTWRRWQAKARAGGQPKGPWPRPARSAARELARKHALAHPVWGHRKIWAMVRHHGHVVSEATILRLLRDEGLILPAHYQRERRKLAERRKAAFAVEPTGPNQVWQLDFSEFETTSGGTWRIAGCRDYWSKLRTPVPRLPDRQPAPRDRRRRARPGRLRGPVRPIAVKVSGIPSQLRPLSGAAVSYPSTRCPLDKVGPCCFGGGMTHRLQAQLSDERIASHLVPLTRAPQRERRAVRSR
jgi:HTH-like domain